LNNIYITGTKFALFRIYKKVIVIIIIIGFISFSVERKIKAVFY
jgi:hypothetical protein